jgi:hypothetical protein
MKEHRLSWLSKSLLLKCYIVDVLTVTRFNDVGHHTICPQHAPVDNAISKLGGAECKLNQTYLPTHLMNRVILPQT